VRDARCGRPRSLNPPGAFRLRPETVAADRLQSSATLAWTESDQARDYRVVLSDAPDFATVRTEKTTCLTKLDLALLPPGQTLYWKVQARSMGGTRWSGNTRALRTAPLRAVPRGVVFASDLPWVQATAAGEGGAVRRDQDSRGQTLRIGREYHPKGIATQAFNNATPADVTFDLAGRTFASFAAEVGLEDSAGRGSVQFQVLADGEPKAQSPLMRLGAVCALRAPVGGAKRVTLRVLNGGDGNSGDKAAWGTARFVEQGAADPFEPQDRAPGRAELAPGSSGALVVEWPVTRCVIQRDSSNTASIRIHGTCSPEAKRIESRLVPRAAGQGIATGWSTLAPGPRDGVFSGSVVGQAGWYDLEVRARSGRAIVAACTVQRVGVGEVFVVVGHSVAAGQDDNIPGATDDRVNAVPLDRASAAFQSYLNTGDARHLPAPAFVHYGTGVVPAPFGSGNYFWSSFGEAIARKQNVPVLIYNAAFGGTSLEHWAKSARGVQFDHSFVNAHIRMPYINLFNALKKYVPVTGVRAVLADQGQNDWPEKDEDLVFGNYMAWVGQARADLGHPGLAIVVNRQTPFLRDTQIRRVQERMIRTPHCFAGPDYDTLPKEARPDAIHLGLAGQEHAARLWAEALDDRFFAQSRPWLPAFNLPGMDAAARRR
jgi:hypothetical protein